MSTASDAQNDVPDHLFDTEPDSFPSGSLPPLTTDDLIRDYVNSALANPRESLGSAAARSAFTFSLLGDTSLARDAHDDALLLHQLECRAVILVKHIANVIPSAESFVTDAFVALLALVAAKCPIVLDTLEKQGVAGVVISTMRRFTHHASIITRCLTALRAFTVTDSMRKRVMFDGGIDVTLDIMSTHQTNHRVQDRAAAVIANVAFGCPHRKRRIARQGGIKKIVDGMAAFPNDENIQLRGALTIRNLTYEAQVNQYIAGNQGAVEAIAATMLRFRGNSANPELRFQCVMALESLCRQDERNRERLVDIGRASLSSFQGPFNGVVEKPAIEPDTEHVNEDGDLVVDEEEILVPNMTTNLRHGAALCPGRPFPVLSGSTSISSSGGSETPVAKLTAGDCLSESIHKCTNSSTEASRASEPDKQLEKPSIVRAIIHALRRDPGDQLLLETGLSLLTLISLDRPTVQVRLGELDGIQVAIAAIRRHPKSEAIVARASSLLRCLCIQEVNREKVTSGLLVLISAARDHAKDPTVIREVTAALGNAVFENEKNRVWVVNKGGIGAVVRAIHESGDKDVMVLEAAICTLRNFIHESHSGAVSATKEGAIRAAVVALDRTKEVTSTGERIVQEQAVMLLSDVATLAPQAKQEMKQIEAGDWIENALAKLSIEQYPELHSDGDELISELSDMKSGKPRSIKRRDERAWQCLETGSDRVFARRILNGIFAVRRKKTRAEPDEKRRLAGQSMPIESAPGRSKRISARFLKNSILS